LGFFSNIHAMTNQVIAAKDAAVSVLRKANAVTWSTLSSLPALNPYQPNQSRPVPRATRGMLWVLIPSLSCAHVKDRRQGLPYRQSRERQFRGKIKHSPLLENSTAPDHMDKGEVNEEQPDRQNSMYAPKRTRFAKAPVINAV